ncbi:MAG TPA: cytochrome c oxidase subunit 4 [Natronosporangium sp.]|jgi:MFS family permease|nr:cytochrome c oxidase subunit 4 [Natronosporangium sp.]
MKTEWRLFLTVAAFFIIASPLYGWWTWYEFGAIEWVGTVALLLCFALTSMIGGFFLVVARRIEPRPEDRPDAEIEEGAGEVGFFSPGSYWPMGMAAAASFGAVGVAYWQWWMIIGGIIAVIVTTAGLLFEYYTGTRRTAVE